jgi:hypothetical protein
MKYITAPFHALVTGRSRYSYSYLLLSPTSYWIRSHSNSQAREIPFWTFRDYFDDTRKTRGPEMPDATLFGLILTFGSSLSISHQSGSDTCY